jgi:hypothetical protein
LRFVPGGVVDGEVVAGELVVVEVRVAGQRPGFDDRGVPGVSERGASGPGPICRFGEDLEAVGFVFQQGDPVAASGALAGSDLHR